MQVYRFREKSSGDSVKLSLKRGIQEIEIDLVLGARPEGMDENRKAQAFSEWMDQVDSDLIHQTLEDSDKN